MSTIDQSGLGQATQYPRHYDPTLLFAIERAANRTHLGICRKGALPFHGADMWNAYELSWLNPRGKPQVALAEFRVPADSLHLVESKSFKLYLNSFAGERLGIDTLRARLEHDLAGATGAPVGVNLMTADRFAEQPLATLEGISLDALDIAIDHYDAPRPEFLATDARSLASETLVSDLLKSNCPVTGQPDWASVQIRYAGPAIDHAGLLRYLVSFREHREFHEACVERIFVDLMRHCAPQSLSVYARYTRRGGLDINPFRSSEADALPNNVRTARQ